MSEAQPRKIIMSGMRPTDRLHIGNYFGALKGWLDLQAEGHEMYLGSMDWHALTTAYKSPKDVAHWRREMIAEWLAWGIDPEKCTIFIQSEVPAHVELYMYFSMLTPLSWLERVPTWKDAEEEAKRTETHNLGRFAYPVLQAADIAVYEGTHVPVGQDQLAHLELSREIIRRFNFLYGTKIPEPQPLLTNVPLVTGTDGRKMSKSYGNTFPLTQEPAELKSNVNKMHTNRIRREDKGDPEKCPVFSYHKLFSSPEDQEWAAHGCRTASIGCGDCKAKLAANVENWMAGPRQAKKEWLKDSKRLDSIIAEGCQRAQLKSSRTLQKVQRKIKFRQELS